MDRSIDKQSFAELQGLGSDCKSIRGKSSNNELFRNKMHDIDNKNKLKEPF